MNKIFTFDHMCDKKDFYTIIGIFLSHMLLITYMLNPECECNFLHFFKNKFVIYGYTIFHFNQLVNKA